MPRIYDQLPRHGTCCLREISRSSKWRSKGGHVGTLSWSRLVLGFAEIRRVWGGTRGVVWVGGVSRLRNETVINVGAQSTLVGQNIFARKMYMKN